MWSTRVRLGVVPALVLVTALLCPRGVWAATVTVTDLGDNGLPGQLRTLMNAAAPGDTVVIPAGTITLTGAAGELFNVGGDLNIRKNLTIRGQGPGVTILDGGGIDRVVRVDGAASATISGVTIRNGNAGGDVGGGIISSGTLTVANSTISGNTAVHGGGISADGGSLTLITVTVSGNTATQDGGGIQAAAPAALTNVTITNNTANRDAGGIASNGTFALTNSTVSANTGQLGGGILNTGTLTLVNSAISGNTASEEGGALRNVGTATLASSTISGNAAVLGGGVENIGFLTLTNVTISGNTASSQGAGLLNAGGGSATLSNVTLAANSGFFSGALRNEAGSSVTLRNTIVQRGQSGANCLGTITSQGHNLSSDDSCLASLTAPGDINTHSALLGPLQDNGGPTQTHGLAAGGGSPAIDGGDNTGCPATDQRGFRRPVDGNGDATPTCDIGAFELVNIATTLLSATLPTERTARAPQPPTTVTAFATVLNTGATAALGCALAPVTPVAATFLYQTTNAQNQLTGNPNTPATIPPGGGQNYLFAFTPTATFPPTEVQLSMACTNSAPAPIVSGVNTFRLRATAAAAPDPVALAATGPPNDGILRLASGVGAFAVATVNVGAPGLLTVSADTGVAALPVTIALCETNSQTGQCLAAPTDTVQRQVGTNETATFGVFVANTAPIAFDPATNRIQVHLEGGGGGGGTGVAVCSVPLCP